uniref:Uncharacterized protein n=1 Tax=Anguilla anguilla TaxID=7936 RepID=A0A0E9T4K1_ANGAN
MNSTNGRHQKTWNMSIYRMQCISVSFWVFLWKTKKNKRKRRVLH